MSVRKKFCTCGKLIPSNKICECKKSLLDGRQKRYKEKNPEAAKILTSSRWIRKRKQIIDRDGGHCQRCLIKFNRINGEELQVHHIIPRVERMDLVFESSNLITVCRTCNLQLGLKGLDFLWNPPEEGHSFNL